jgi:hypothetical protein
MTKHWPGFGSDQPSVESDATASSSPNGVSPEDVAGAPGGLEEQVARDRDISATDNGTTAPDPWADAEVGAAAAAVDDAQVFLAELVRTLQSTAGLERVRVAEDTERRRQAHIDQIRARQTSEADRMRELADDDTKAIDAWADGETKRIQLERERRATKRQGDLESSLAEHTSKIDAEIDRVEAAIAAYRAEVDLFFDGLDRQTDLVLIAKQATRRPAFPVLDDVSEPAAASSGGADDGATGEEANGQVAPAGVGVMDPDAASQPVESWLVPPATSVDPEPATASEEGSTSRSMFQSVAVHRPMGRPRRDEGDRSDD